MLLEHIKKRFRSRRAISITLSISANSTSAKAIVKKRLKPGNKMVADEKANAENYERLAQLLDTKNYRAEAIAASRKAVELMPDVVSLS